MSAMTEQEQEKAARARIDRLAEIRREHAARKGISPHDVRLTPADMERADREAEAPAAQPAPAASGNKTARAIEAGRRLADADNRIERAAFFRAMGAEDDPAERKRIGVMLVGLRKSGRFPYEFDCRKPGPRPAASGPRPGLSALRRYVAGDDVPGPTPPAVAPEASPSDPASLAELAARIDRLWDEMTGAERAFAAGYIRHRFS